MNEPLLTFRFDGMPPRRTLQAGRGIVRDDSEPSGVRVFTREPQRAEAFWMRELFASRLPPDWKPLDGAVKVRVELVYPARKRDRIGEDELVPHIVKPDADNLVKGLLDSATRAGVWVDDAVVWDLRVRKWRGRRPRWAVFVWNDNGL